MKCERCGDDTHVSRYDVDGFTGYLCEECLEKWETIST
jgi:transposase-like protein